MSTQHNGMIQECKRCGTCCRRGGPALHLKDKELILKGVLLPRDLVTYRRHELAFDPKEGRLILLNQEIIKIKGRQDIGECKYFNQDTALCNIYKDRPLECRVLKCWDTVEIEGLLLQDLLTRGHLIPNRSTLWALIEKYDRVFDLELIQKTVSCLVQDSKGLSRFISDLGEKDEQFRKMVCANYQLDSEELKFFFGRPIFQVLNSMLEGAE